MKILSIGNSFSQDAQHYLKGVCDAAGADIYNVNLFAGGCSLLRHHKNMLSGDKDYQLEEHGVAIKKGRDA